MRGAKLASEAVTGVVRDFGVVLRCVTNVTLPMCHKSTLSDEMHPMSQDHLEEHWRVIFGYAAREDDREKLAELVVKVNHLLDTIERRMMKLDAITQQSF